MSLSEQVASIIGEAGLEIAATRSEPAADSQHGQIPPALHPDAAAAIRSITGGSPWSHQTDALRVFLGGKSVCLATPTASGKSLVFMAASIHLIKTLPGAKVLALYPIKALIQDQRDKWDTILRDQGLTSVYIDGSVPVSDREPMLARADIVLMTPDVLHAWLLQHLEKPMLRKFVAALRTVIIDEAHIYDGCFGTNMAFLLRRLEAVAGPYQLIASTATVGEPEAFLLTLTGRQVHVIGPEANGMGSHGRDLICARLTGPDSFSAYVELVRRLSASGLGRFLAFADSRKLVEQVVARASRRDDGSGEELATEDLERIPISHMHRAVLPYRAGYEEEDRAEIQRALTSGTLGGVVATSAMEMGLDIGDLTIVVLLGTPASAKTFWQRAGRTARRTFGICILIDTDGVCSGSQEDFDAYLARAAEKNWLYLDNKYLQFANAMCAAIELQSAGVPVEQAEKSYSTLPPDFMRYAKNEITPTELLPQELLQLKMRAGGTPHFEFPLRNAIDRQYQVMNRGPIPKLGTLSYAQVLREGYPGAVYYYLARPYRVIRHKLRSGEIEVRKERYWTTKPIAQNMVFPQFAGGLLNLSTGDIGFLVESEMQVSERVLGFVEKRGSNDIPINYTAGNEYAQRPLTRYFETTGVCWYTGDGELSTERIANAILDAYCSIFGVQRRDVGCGTFFSKTGPTGGNDVKGACIYDATYGSLRLTQRVYEHFNDLIDEVISQLDATDDDEHFCGLLERLRIAVSVFAPTQLLPSGVPSVTQQGPWVKLVKPQSIAIHRDSSGTTEEVRVIAYRYTPTGLMYELEQSNPDVAWRVAAELIVPIPGITEFIEVNFETDESRPVD